MGAAIVRRLLAAGYPVVGWNRSEEKAAPLRELGMGWAGTPAAAAAASDITISILTDARALEEVVGGPGTLVDPGGRTVAFGVSPVSGSGGT